ncbi:MAG: hypothetical protein CME62_08130 [Halobacteriovoraceae bacterium]|nr:hypothetical protein [Halobacteriovoraceae bacterium]|tara:strand:- start:12571 stop:13248 length:678 start_codon:yes stop_codon:yes gene_type:complete
MNKVAIVLGTSSSIGSAVVKSLLRRGFLVFGGSRTESEIDHDNFIDIELDITKKNHIHNFLEEVSKETEVVDLMINLINLCEMASTSDTNDLDLTSHFNVNVLGYFNFLKAFEPLVLAEETYIINVFSLSGKNYYPNTLAYSVSEHAKKALTKIFEKEWKKYDIRFTQIFTGAIDTDFWDDYPEADKTQMMSVQDFTYYIDMLLDAPVHIQLPELTFTHKSSFID